MPVHDAVRPHARGDTPPDPGRPGPADPVRVVRRLAATPERTGCLAGLRTVPERPGSTVPFPSWVPPALVSGLRRNGIDAPWAHQVAAAEHARAGRHVVVATGTASGKSLAYLLPALSAVLAAERADRTRRRSGPWTAAGATALYLSPTKALAADQLHHLRALGLPALRCDCYDGDTAREERDWIRAHASYVLTNPDMLHRSVLPDHARWARFLAGLRYVVVDECHHYRGVFGSHVAQVLRRLLRVSRHYGAEPVVLLASATVAAPAESAARLAGVPVVAVTADDAPRGRLTVALWEPPAGPDPTGRPARRGTTGETADLLAACVAAGVRTVAFVASRRGVETVAGWTRDRLAAAGRADLAERVAAYRGGYLPEERRQLEQDLHTGRLLGVAATNALELGVDVAGLDAVLVAGFPGSRVAFRQQVGRAGRAGQDALAVLVARDDPLDAYLVHHPGALLGAPVEATVLDPDNPYVLTPHLAAAAAELPLAPAELAAFGPGAPGAVDALERAHRLRRRPAGWYWVGPDRRPGDAVDIRGTGGGPVRLVEVGTGRLLGTVDAAAAPATVHAGAVYVHQGRTFLVDTLDLDAAVALVRSVDVDYLTQARTVSAVHIERVARERRVGGAVVADGDVAVTAQTVGYLRRRVGTGEVVGEEPLDLPERALHTRAVWWLPAGPAPAGNTGHSRAGTAGAVHAVEHLCRALLPLFATCDRRDVGGSWSPHHPDTGGPTVLVYDDQAGGAGFAARGFDLADRWFRAVRDTIAACGCPAGCPSCVQSPACGSRNTPLDKAGALAMLGGVPRHGRRVGAAGGADDGAEGGRSCW